CGGVAGRAVDQGRGGDQRGQQQRRGGPEGGGGGGRRRQQAVAREPVAVHHPFGLLVGLVGADREQAGGHRRQRGPEEEGEAQPAVPDGIADLGGGGEGRDRQKRGQHQGRHGGGPQRKAVAEPGQRHGGQQDVRGVVPRPLAGRPGGARGGHSPCPAAVCTVGEYVALGRGAVHRISGRP